MFSSNNFIYEKNITQSKDKLHKNYGAKINFATHAKFCGLLIETAWPKTIEYIYDLGYADRRLKSGEIKCVSDFDLK